MSNVTDAIISDLNTRITNPADRERTSLERSSIRGLDLGSMNCGHFRFKLGLISHSNSAAGLLVSTSYRLGTLQMRVPDGRVNLTLVRDNEKTAKEYP